MITSKVQRFIFDEPSEGSALEFRLVYKGRLPAETNRPRVQDKHRIRREFHGQLTELWKRNPALNRQRTNHVKVRRRPANTVIESGDEVIGVDQGGPGDPSWVEHLAETYKICGFRFVPLVRKDNGFTCAIKILFLRRGHPGELISNGGDIDNRVKVLFDALKMPKNCGEVQADPQSGEDPFFCLLEDDALITSVEITTDRLLTPLADNESENDVELVIHVTVIDPEALFGFNKLV
ncbi:MAG: hypothetical protein JWO19_2100 [Bryobacterales bacterium]|nr:hypothetical protein [Bryobacterales bacterium]